jgi:hypothetical protein
MTWACGLYAKGGIAFMTIYSVVLFIHVVSAIGLFVALAAEGVVLFRIRSAQSTEEARFFIGAFQRLRVIAIPAFLGILVGGLYLASKYGGGTFWIPLGLGATLLIMVVGGIVTGRKMFRLKSALSKTENVTSFDPIRTGRSDNALILIIWIAIRTGCRDRLPDDGQTSFTAFIDRFGCRIHRWRLNRERRLPEFEPKRHILWCW